MRIWDVSPGYLNRQSLLGEHRELHGFYNILTEKKVGYSRHPETKRWVGAVSGLCWRHAQLCAEMQLRGYVDRTPLGARRGRTRWPAAFVDDPASQIEILRRKYTDREAGRIPLPRTPQELWAQHKYSVMARSPERYGELGRVVARMPTRATLDDLATELVLILTERPSAPRLLNAIEHMWGYVRAITDGTRSRRDAAPAEALRQIQRLALRAGQPYLLGSTALSDLAVFIA